MKKNTKATCRKSVTFLAAAAMTAALLSGQAYPTIAMGQTQTVEKGTLIPDNVTIDEPTSLSNIDLPKSDYGTLSWADSSYVPDSRVQSCKVEFKPNGSVDLSGYSGWDAEKGVLTGYVTVVVSSIAGSDEDYKEDYYDSEENGEEGTEASSDISGSDDAGQTADGEYTEASGEAAATPGAEVTEAPEEATVTPEVEASGTPEGVTVTPRAEVTEAPEGVTVTPGAEATEVPEKVTVTPGAEVTTVPEEVTATPGAEVTAEPADDTLPADSQEPVTDETQEPSVATPEVTAAPEENNNNIFDNPADFAAQDTRPSTAEENLSPEEEMERARQNHSCDGIFVSGIELPWYVQFRVSSGESYEFKNEADAMIFQSYEFELWDLRNNTEYEIPDGEYISVTVPVKEGYSYTIEHILDNGATETIVPSVNGGTMVFSTHSFSPFGIAGSKPLVGGDIAQDGYSGQITASPTPTVQATATMKPVQTPTGSAGNITNTNTAGSAGTNTGTSSNNTTGSASGGATKEGTVRNIYGDQSGQTDTNSSQNTNTSNTQNTNTNGSSTVNTVRTGDDTVILPFVILVAAAVVVIVIAAAVKKKRS